MTSGASAPSVEQRARALLELDDDAVVTFETSGSTATPRTVRRTVGSWSRSVEPFSAVTGIGPDDVVWAPGGAGSTLTLFAAFHALAVGAGLVTTGPWRGVVPQAAAATVVQCVPSVLAEILDADPGTTRLRAAVVAGAALPQRLRDAARARGLDVLPYYGAAELSFVAAGRDRLVAFPGVEVEEREGVLWCRSPYLCLDAAGLLRDGDGWATVGDLGRVGRDGTVEVLGRAGALSVGGTVVAAADVEAALSAAAGVAEVVCLVQDDERFGERPVAVLRPMPGVAVRDAVAAARVAARGLPAAARPVRYVVPEVMPRTAGGKVARAELAAGLGLRCPDGRGTGRAGAPA